MSKKTKSLERTERGELSTESYKGVRDFYPDEMYIHNYILDTMATAVERFGYVGYSASVLEYSELYEAKSGEEIIHEQTYSFTDRGDRRVTLRPEMTPTIARMIAAHKRELAFPLRWYSIPNLFRYERPQRGRLREHWQLNVDLFGSDSVHADVEIITVAKSVMDEFDAHVGDYEIRVSSREILNHLFSHYNLSRTESQSLTKLLDRMRKINIETFRSDLQEILKEKQNLWEIFFDSLYEQNFDRLPSDIYEHESYRRLKKTIELLSASGIEVIQDFSIVRGFDYYTGIVFEVFDTHPDNNRSMFGGGRYDDLLQIFGQDTLPAVGFGMGDVTMRDFLKTHNLLPDPVSPTDIYICVLDDHLYSFVESLAKELRKKDLNVAIDYTNKKVGDQIKIASKLGIPFTLCIGTNEKESNSFMIKNMKTGEETTCKSADDIASYIFGS